MQAGARQQVTRAREAREGLAQGPGGGETRPKPRQGTGMHKMWARSGERPEPAVCPAAKQAGVQCPGVDEQGGLQNGDVHTEGEVRPLGW